MFSLKWIKSLASSYLLTSNNFLPELHLKEPIFTYGTCGPFTKHHERIQKLRETGNLKHFYRNELDKACFAHNATYCESKDLTKGTIVDKILKGKAYEITRNHNYGGYQRALASKAYKVFDKKTGSETIAGVIEQLVKELHESVFKNLKEDFFMRDLKTIFRRNNCLQRIKMLNIYNAW